MEQGMLYLFPLRSFLFFFFLHSHRFDKTESEWDSMHPVEQLEALPKLWNLHLDHFFDCTKHLLMVLNEEKKDFLNDELLACFEKLCEEIK